MVVEVQGLSKSFDDLLAVDDVSLSIKDGEFLTLVGPSGCGKTTTLRCISGLEKPSSGKILFEGEDVTYESPREREVGFVFQNYALYPHMTARRNMSFPLEHQGLPEKEIENRIENTAEMLGITAQLDKKPGSLSGGQQQRVALGRSLVRQPSVFLLDEPLSNLDAKLRIQMRAELQQIHDDLNQTMIYVTHDQEEAMTMSDRVAILNEGRLQQLATPEEIYHKPVNRFVAGFVGSPAMNFIPCKESGGTIRAGEFTLPTPDGVVDPVELGIRPEYLAIEEEPTGVMAEVSVYEQVGSFNIIYLDVDGHEEEIVVQVEPEIYVEPGDVVSVSIDNGRFHLFDENDRTIHNPPLHRNKFGEPSYLQNS